MRRRIPLQLLLTLLFLLTLVARAGLSQDAQDTFEPFFFFHAADSQLTGNPAIPSRLARMRSLANALHPDFVVMCGDLVDTPANTLYDQYIQTTQNYSVPYYQIPGNHDVYPGGIEGRPDRHHWPWADLAAYRGRFGADYYRLTHKDCDLYFLDSPVLRDRSVFGEDYDQEWAWLQGAIPSSVGRTHVLFFSHHPPFLSRIDEPPDIQNLNWPVAERVRLLSLVDQVGGRYFFVGHLHHDQVYTRGPYTIYIPTGPMWDLEYSHPHHPIYTYRIVKVLQDCVESIKLVFDQDAATSPTAPANLTVRRLAPGRFEIDCDAATGGVGVLFYDFYRDGKLVKRSLTPSFIEEKLPLGRLYNYTVRAVDPYGNQSPASAPFPFDTTSMAMAANKGRPHR